MAKVLVNETSLNGIAAAIRNKNGESTKYKPSEMAAAITALSVGGDGGESGVPNPIVFTGNCNYLFGYNRLTWLLENYANQMSFEDVSAAEYMFCENTAKVAIKPIEFSGACDCYKMFSYSNIILSEDTFNFENVNQRVGDTNYMFDSYDGDYIPTIKQKDDKYYETSNMYRYTTAKVIGEASLSPSGLSQLFNNAKYLRECPEIKFLNDRYRTYSSANNGQIFTNCFSLRKVPESVLKKFYNEANSSTSYLFFNQIFSGCYALDEVIGISPRTATLTASNAFNGTFNKCSRVKDIIFDTNNGTPYTANWKGLNLDLTQGVGWHTATDSYMTDYNSGITIDKKVVDTTSYNALKNDPDWYTNDPLFSRYNHDSAVKTLQSLPDTSSYLASAGGTNTIQFRNNAGSMTDGGSIGSLTEEEIAVATAKGWTVAYKT